MAECGQRLLCAGISNKYQWRSEENFIGYGVTGEYIIIQIDSETFFRENEIYFQVSQMFPLIELNVSVHFSDIAQ